MTALAISACTSGSALPCLFIWVINRRIASHLASRSTSVSSASAIDYSWLIKPSSIMALMVPSKASRL